MVFIFGTGICLCRRWELLNPAESQNVWPELGLRYQLNDYLYFDVDANYTHARSIDEPNGQNYIPLAPDSHLQVE
jgi:hypothetical protein